MKQNKGFSLVELIIVIAIMAILTGIIAPQLIKYTEKTNVSADTQLCDTIHDAIIIAMSDPDVVTDETSQKMLFESGGIMDPAAGGCRLDHYGAGSAWVNCEFAKDVEETTGMSLFAMGSDHSQYLRSKGAKDNGIICVVPNSEGTDCAVYIAWSDREAKGNVENYTGSYDGIESSKVIYVK
jgi:prepilin-type N-terminal cleavage/methylation domain-containing protein